MAYQRVRLAFGVWLALSSLPDASAQEATAARTWKAIFHVDFRSGDPHDPNIRPMRKNNFRWETGGARMTMPAGAGKAPTAGITANFQIKGDFEITASYEILKAEQPSEGYGVGVSMYVAIEPRTMDAVSLSRRLGVDGKASFLSHRMTPTDSTAPPTFGTRPSKANHGILQVQRMGNMARFFVAEGGSTDFLPIYQDRKSAKKEVEVEFGSGDIRYFQVGGDAGDSQAAVDVRLLELTVGADELPGLLPTASASKEEPAWMRNARENKGSTPAAPRGSAWLFAIIGVGGLATVVGGGICGFVWLKRRSGAQSPVRKLAKPPVGDNA